MECPEERLFEVADRLLERYASTFTRIDRLTVCYPDNGVQYSLEDMLVTLPVRCRCIHGVLHPPGTTSVSASGQSPATTNTL